MKKWLVPANLDEWHHDELFAEDGYIDWPTNNNYNIGDIAYIYCTEPVKKILFKTIVQKKSKYYDEDSEYNKCVRLCLIEQMDNDKLSYENLRNHGLNGPIRKTITLKDELETYVEKIFKKYSKKDKKANLIYFGAPGTGKSHKVDDEKKELLKDYNDENYERVTFHPDYTYANFVGTYKPVFDGKRITYEYVPGPFMRTLIKALKNPSQPFVLIIEEINRANVAAVFGDVFQLLDRNSNDNVSKFSINVSEDMKKYLIKELKCRIICLEEYLGKNCDKIKIPPNMFIWATMNSADQGVFPMDTAFKRRWDFEYFDIHNGEEDIDYIKVNLNNKEFSWNQIRNAINNELITYGINEDKLMGPFFAFTNYIKEDLPEGEVVKIDTEEFKDIFMNKIIMYLFEDVARAKRDVLFKGALERQNNDKNITYYQICDDFKENELEIFSRKIRNELGIGE